MPHRARPWRVRSAARLVGMISVASLSACGLVEHPAAGEGAGATESFRPNPQEIPGGSARAGPLLAGAARADLLQGLTMPVQMASYGPLPGRSRGVREPLHARAVLLENGQARMAIVSCDLLILDDALRAEALRRIGAGGIVLDAFLLTATHTHTSLGAYVDHFAAEFYMLGEFERAVRDHIAERIASAVLEAASKARPARIGAGRAFVEGVSRNRRIGTTVDPEVGILRITDAAGEPLAAIVNFAAHPVLEPNDGTLSPDYPGILARRLDRSAGFGLFLQGALGDIDATFPGAREAGAMEWRAALVANRLAQAVERALGSIETRGDVILGVEETSFALPSLNPGLIPDILFPLDWLVAFLLSWPTRAPLQAIRIGDAAIVATASEASVRLGLQIKRRSPSRFPFVVTHANSYAGYAVEQCLHAKRKLDPTSMVALGGATHGTRLVESAIGLLEKLWGEGSGSTSGRLSPAAAARLEEESRGLPPIEREALARSHAAREEEDSLEAADNTIRQSRNHGLPIRDSVPDRVRIEVFHLQLDDLRGGMRLPGHRRETGGLVRVEGPADLRFAAWGGHVHSEWRAAGSRRSDEGPSDLAFLCDRPFTLLDSPLGGNALRLIPAVSLTAPTGDADSSAPFAFAAGTGVWRPGAGAALELTWETCHALSIDALYTTSIDRHDGRRPGDRLDAALRYAERHGVASILLDLTAALRLPDRRRGGREESDVDETSFDLGLRPGLALHAGERVEIFGQAILPLLRSGSGAGAGRGVLVGVSAGF
ncbi:MAG TPA: neutral/alkaline non-lysosomal ceramidase N-terminal domain-containing protein [Planctomycetota bacterium]|nr:neutral/alkaline non-lysosomal ceramidase N-terminal domain-containing protein [Planctomycetota bacterium]